MQDRSLPAQHKHAVAVHLSQAATPGLDARDAGAVDIGCALLSSLPALGVRYDAVLPFVRKAADVIHPDLKARPEAYDGARLAALSAAMGGLQLPFARVYPLVQRLSAAALPHVPSLTLPYAPCCCRLRLLDSCNECK